MAADTPATAPYLRLRQVCLAAPALGPAVAAVEAVLGLPVCHRDPAVAAYGLVNALFVCGQAFLEVVAPIDEGAGVTACERFIAKNRDAQGLWGGYMAIFDCDDPLARRAQLLARGVRVAHAMDYPGFRGTQFHPRDCRAVMLEFDHSDGGESADGAYWPAGPHWQGFQRPQQVAGLPCIELESPDPVGLAAHWAGLTGRPLQYGDAGAGGAPGLAFDLGRARFVRGASERLALLEVAVPDPAATLAAARGHGLVVEAGAFLLAGTWLRPTC